MLGASSLPSRVCTWNAHPQLKTTTTRGLRHLSCGPDRDLSWRKRQAQELNPCPIIKVGTRTRQGMVVTVEKLNSVATPHMQFPAKTNRDTDNSGGRETYVLYVSRTTAENLLLPPSLLPNMRGSGSGVCMQQAAIWLGGREKVSPPA